MAARRWRQLPLAARPAAGGVAGLTAVAAAIALAFPATDRPARPAAADAAAPARAGTTATSGPSAGSSVPPSNALLGLEGAISAGPTKADPARAAVVPPSALAAAGIPSTALAAYKKAAAAQAAAGRACRLPWPLLAAIGRVESNHGRFAGAVLRSDGTSAPRIIGIALNGKGTALIRDTDDGRLDGDTVYDHAVGPMQFIPSTWATSGRDGNGDGKRDPFNVYDAAAAAAGYLCAAGRDLGTYAGQVRAVFSYNHSTAYVDEVLGLEKIYATQVGVTVPVIPTDPAKRVVRGQHPTLPPVDPGPPRALVPSPPKHPASTPSTTASSKPSSTRSAPASSEPASTGATTVPTQGQTIGPTQGPTDEPTPVPTDSPTQDPTADTDAPSPTST